MRNVVDLPHPRGLLTELAIGDGQVDLARRRHRQKTFQTS
jgi:hypothetical protein